jgi:uncharacterized membrane protein YjgN (DUF898 family)
MNDAPAPAPAGTSADANRPILPAPPLLPAMPPLPPAEPLALPAEASLPERPGAVDGVPPASALVVEVLAGAEAVAPADASAPPAADAVSTTATATPPPLLPPPLPAEPVSHPVVFHGRAEEFFRIWIVNTLLTLLTCGVFFAWAKVRKRRYLRGSTELLGHRFDYRADPLRLLLGHGVVLCLVLGYSLFGVVYPAVRFGVIGLGVILLPWIVVRSMSFNAHNTVYRGLHFRFNRSLSAAARVYLLEPLLIPFTLGLYYPAWQRSKRAYAISSHRFGDAYFSFHGDVGRFYSTYIAAGLIVVAAAMAGGFLIGVALARQPGVQPTLVQLIPFFVFYAFGFYVGRHLIYARLFNHVWNHTRLDAHRFEATLDPAKWLRLQLTNLGAMLVSAGMLYPWALMRAERYAASCLRFVPGGPVDRIRGMGGSAGSATGDMAAEFIGIDFGL